MTIAKFHNKTLFVIHSTFSFHPICLQYHSFMLQVKNHLLQTVLNILSFVHSQWCIKHITQILINISWIKQFLYPGRPHQVRSFWTCLQWVPEPSCSMNSKKNTTAMQNNGNTFILFWIVQCQKLLLFLQLRCCWLRGCRGSPTPGLILFCWLTLLRILTVQHRLSGFRE